MQVLLLLKSQKIPPKILIVSQSHTAVDNIIEGLNCNDIRILRIGNKNKFSDIVQEQFSIESHRSRLFSSIDSKSNAFIDQKLCLLGLDRTLLEKSDSSDAQNMIPNIGNLISKVFYNNELSSGTNAVLLAHNMPTYNNCSIVWHNTSTLANHDQQRTREGGSYANSTECRIIIRILHDISRHDFNLNVGVITGYSFQKQMIERAVESQNLRNNFKQLKVDTVDSFQGRENDIVIFSTVRTKDSIGFQKYKERVNVAFSRAKKLLIIVGDLNFMANYDDVNNKFMLIEDYISTNHESKIIQEV